MFTFDSIDFLKNDLKTWIQIITNYVQRNAIEMSLAVSSDEYDYWIWVIDWMSSLLIESS